MSEAPTKKKTRRPIRVIVNVSLFAILTALAIYYILRDDPRRTFGLLGDSDFFPMLLAIGVVVIVDLLDGLALFLLARLYNKGFHFFHGVINQVIGNFTGSFVKTSANFIQAYTFTKQGVSGANAASILTMNFLMFQGTLTIYSLGMVCFGYPYVADIPLQLIGGWKIFPISFLGFAIDALIFLLIVMVAFFKPLHYFVLNSGVNLLTKLHILKDPELTRRKWALQFATYRIESKRLMSHKGLMITIFFLNLLKQFLLNSIPYLCFWALKADMSQVSFTVSLFRSSYLSLISSFITMGGPEVAFQSIFSYASTVNGLTFNLGSQASSITSAGNLLWRGLTFYFNIIVGGICFLAYRGSPSKYELRSNTATMYDLQVANLTLNNPPTKKDDVEYATNLLTAVQVEASFDRIRRNMSDSPAREPSRDLPKEDLAKTLAEQQTNLKLIVEETQALLNHQSLDPEIQKATEEELSENKKMTERKAMRKQERQTRKEEKSRRKLEGLQPDGTTITVSKESGIIIHGPEIRQQQTQTTSDPNEEKGTEEK
jgi:glycosyltransferase 2 family protein